MGKAWHAGDSIRMVTHDGGSIMGVVCKTTPRRVWVWTGTTGFGQKRWPFDGAGRPVGFTAVAFPGLRLDVDYVDPFKAV